MSHLKKAQVVMLPTNEKAHEGKRLKFVTNYNHEETLGYMFYGHNPQHLYILSDEEIKEGDWVIDYIDNTPSIFQIKDEAHLQVVFNLADAKKIIATTDSSLQISFGRTAQPSQSFLEVYAREYNKGNGIKEVMVEYELIEKVINEELGAPRGTFGEIQFSLKLKINPKDNTITIKRVKNSWNKEEVELKLRDWASFICTGRGQQWTSGDLDKWIEQNLL